MTFVSLCCRSDDWLWEALVLLHSLRELNTTDLTATVLVVAPCRTCKDATDNHLNTESLALQTYSNLWIRSSQFPVRADVSCCVKELGSNLIQNLSLERNTLWQDNIEC